MSKRSLMYKWILAFLVLIIGMAASAVAQTYDPAMIDSINKLQQMDIKDMDPVQIPSESELRIYGVPEDKISELMRYKQEQLELMQDTLPVQILEKPPEPEDITTEKEVAKVPALPEPNMYGQSFFRNKRIDFFESATDIKAPENYVLGVGDEVSIVVWGYSDYNEVFRIDQTGAISPKGVGRIYLKGMAFRDARKAITRRFAGYLNLSNSQIDISLIYSRVITVNIVGEVFEPGSYTIPAINTAFNALAAAQGPSQIGSVRSIYIRRGGKLFQTLDVYEFLLNPESAEEFFLQDNDYIFVPPVTKVVSIEGEIKRPHNYELKEGETLQSLVYYAGGLTASAYNANVQVTRITSNEQVIIDVDLDSLIRNKLSFQLKDGDQVRIHGIPVGITNYVRIQGSVKIPGDYELRQNDKIKDVLSRAEGILHDAYIGKAYVIRLQDDMSKDFIPFNLGAVLRDKASAENIALQAYDEILVFSKEDFREDLFVSVQGAVRKQGDYLFGDGLKLMDVLYLAGGFKVEAATNRIEVSRVISSNGEGGSDQPVRTIVKSIAAKRDLEMDQASKNFVLEPYDQIFVRSIPGFELQQNIEIRGEVLYNGTYSLIDKNERISDLIERAGGLSNWAFVGGASITRTENNAGRLVLDLKKALDNPKSSKFNYVLKDGDIITIPKINELIKVGGEINYPEIEKIGAFNAPYHKGRRAAFYIKKYGTGFTKESIRRNTIVTQAGGYVKKAKSYGLFKVYPIVGKGGEIEVPKRVKREERLKREKEPFNWNKFADGLLTKATVVLTLYILLERVNTP